MLGIALCAALAACSGPQAPALIRAEAAKTPPGMVTVVEFIDYQCPFCRAMDRELSPVLQEYASRVRVVRKHVPLRRHAHARTAAKAEVCAEAAGRGEPMHAALMSSPDLSVQSIGMIGREMALDTDSLVACMRGDAAESRVRADEADFDAVGGNGVPTVFIGSRVFEGLTSSEELREALEAELGKR